MINKRYEDYNSIDNKKNFVLFDNLVRSKFKNSTEMNWHENIEIELCIEGRGKVFIDGLEYEIVPKDVVIINSNAIHYTYTDDKLVYSALIVSSRFCKSIGIDYELTKFKSVIKDNKIADFFTKIRELNSKDDFPFREIRQNMFLIEILAEAAERYSTEISTNKYDSMKSVKDTLTYIHGNYSEKITLDMISKSINTDKFLICRQFKEATGKTVIEYTNAYRCQKAAELIASGCNISEAAHLTGFNNFSFFTKTFKKYMGDIPSKFKEKTL